MSSRANLIIVEEGNRQTFFCRGCASTLDDNLFWGPQFAAEFIRSRYAVDATEFMNDLWAAGGVILDFDQRVLLFFGGEGVRFDAPFRHFYIELMRRVWKSWDVRWAYEGVASLADHLGYPPEKVLSNEAEQDEFGPVCSLNPAKEKGWTDIVASILWSPGHLGLYPLAGYPVPYLAAGLPLLSVPEAKHGYRQIALGDWIDEFPTGGFHIDVPSKTIEFWTIDPRVDATRRLSAVWPGWTVIWRKDDYEFQSERTSGYLQFPLVNRQDLEQRIMDHFLTDRNYPFEPPREIRLQILAATLEPDVDSITPYDRR